MWVRRIGICHRRLGCPVGLRADVEQLGPADLPFRDIGGCFGQVLSLKVALGSKIGGICQDSGQHSAIIAHQVLGSQMDEFIGKAGQPFTSAKRSEM